MSIRLLARFGVMFAAYRPMKTRALLLGCIAVLTCAVPARAMIISYSYDSAGRLTKANYGGASNTTYKYDDDGNLLARMNSVNPFLPLAGKYSGLVSAAAPDANNGGFISIAITKGGSFTGRLLLGARKFQLTGVFDANGDATAIPLAFPGLPAVQLALHLDLATGTLTGSVTGGIVSTVSALASPYARSRPAPGGFVGKFTALFDATENVSTVPKGSGFALVKVKANGGITLAGSLADGTVIAQGAAFIDTTRWPLFVRLYGKKGRLEGFVDFATDVGVSDCAGAVTWFKSPANGGRYAAGFDTTINFLGARYHPPARQQRVLDFGDTSPNAAFTLNGVERDATLSRNNTIVISPPNTDHLTLVLDPVTGLLNGSFREGATKRKLRGVVQQEANRGAGYFLGASESLPFTLEAL
ncbi:MAG TPA: RHS repeat domain-containing protein [Chthoniobacteraceae bacterium]|jgi:YD repeat-containing protein|nr:RHS repeat domain-containing protein [Chthoniobacteraceae bacterium]